MINLVQKSGRNIFTTINLFILLGIIMILVLSIRPAFDPDMGWHLKDGEYLLKSGWQVPKTDIYSYTMPDFPFIMHEWLTDIGMYSIYNHFGLPLLSIIFVLITAAAFVVSAIAVPARREYQIIAALVGCIASLNIIGVRPQMITLLFLAILLNLIYHFRSYPQTKIIYLLPVLFLVWVNLHGGFPSGLVVLGLFLFFELLKKAVVHLYKTIRKKIINLPAITWFSWRKIFCLSFLSGIVTLINPYGWRIYIEVITTITDSYLKHNISEWVPVSVTQAHSFRFLAYLGLLLILTLISIRKIDFTHLGITAVFAWFAFSSWRNVPIFIVISIPLWVYIVKGLVGESLSKIIKNKGIIALLLFGVVVSVFQSRQMLSTILSSKKHYDFIMATYPYQAVQYLKANPISGNMFNDYDWGGFLIWQYPEQKVFVDGRMPSWRQNGEHVFGDHQQISNISLGFRELLKEYDVSWVITKSNSLLAIALVGDGWEGVYQDNKAAILKKPVAEKNDLDNQTE